MEDVRQLVQEEGREARNLVAFHVAVDTPARISKKPPKSSVLLPRRAPPRPPSRLRSASAGRDKRSELRARYWALLFGDLQRAIGEIYNTVESHENLSECQEVILVLENYTRDFKALCEWFRLKWEYDNTPPPQRPQSLAWEIRKTDFVRPESRKAHSVRSSPSVSGKNSPCLSGHNTPSGKNSPNLLTGKTSPGSGKISPRVSTSHSNTSPKANLEFFSNKITASKVTAKPEPKVLKESRLSDIKEKVVDIEADINSVVDSETMDTETVSPVPKIEVGKAKEFANAVPKPVVVKNSAKTGKHVKETSDDLSSQAKATIAKLNAMECSFLEKQLIENAVKNENMINTDKDSELKQNNNKPNKEISVSTYKSKSNDAVDPDKSPTISEDNFADISNESSPIEDINRSSSIETDKAKVLKVKEVPNDTKTSKDAKTDEIIKDDSKDNESKKPEVKPLEAKSTRPAYSQAAAKPKLVTASKPEVKATMKTTPIVRSKTVVEIRPVAVAKPQKTFTKKNQNLTTKCSYPFNLTTGRTSLFDSTPATSAKPPGARKPLNKNYQLAAGDSKPKQDVKKPPLKRPTSVKLGEKDVNDKTNSQFGKTKDYEEYGSSDTVVAQFDSSRMELSESLITLVPEDSMNDIANSIEVLNVDRNDDDGWLTVKSRRLSRESKKQSKSHWSNRFHQPSATTSLPTLNMIESPRQEAKTVDSKQIQDRAKSEQPENVQNKTELKLEVEEAKPELKVEVKVEKNEKPVRPKSNKDKVKNTAMIRQKSDVTGLKTRSARNKAVSKKSEKAKENRRDNSSELTKNRLHSSLESLTGLLRSQESTEDSFDFDKWKTEFKSYFKYFEEDDQISDHNEILKTADPSEMSEIAEMTSQIEENERKISLALDFQTEVDQRKLCEEEDLLNRQIMELQQVSDVDLDTETDDTETDAEILCDDAQSLAPSCPSPEKLGALAATLEEQYETALAGMSWAERVDTLVVLQALVARDPGRAQQLHSKLSQGIKRRGSFQDALRRLQAKQARAEQQRLDLQTERSKKIHMLLARVEEVKVAKNQLIEEKRLRMERRLQKAQENRDQHLKDIVRKAHDEEEKLREIAFIKQLEAENRRHDLLDQCRAHNTRLRSVRRDRLDKLEQKAAREAAVGARRQAIEEARRLHVNTLVEKRKERDARVEELKEQKKQERDDAAREKAQGVKSRLSALAAAAAALRTRIRDKHSATQHRIDEIRARGRARAQTTSESQELENENEQEPELTQQEEIDIQTLEKRERDRQKSVRKRARKLRQKLMLIGHGFELMSAIEIGPLPPPGGNKIWKLFNQINNLISPLVQDYSKEDHAKMIEKLMNNTADNNVIEKNGLDKTKNEKVNDNDKPQVNGQHEVVEKKKSKKKKGANADKQTKETNENSELIINNNESDKPNNNNENVKKGKNKKRTENDKNKMSKASSVASSMSDMSKVSAKNDKKINTDIDWLHVEKMLNELNRITEKIDKLSQDVPVHALKILSQLLSIAVDKQETGLQVTTKSLWTAMSVMSRMVGCCPVAATYFVNTNGCLHVTRLLAVQLEKDLEADKQELNLTKQLADCLSISFDSVLCTTRIYEECKESDKMADIDDEMASSRVALLSVLRNRVHGLISYLCLSGCIELAEDCGSAREGVHTLMTVCADLCHPCDVDDVQDRQTAVACLKTAIAGGICGSRAEFCRLFDRGATIQNNNGSTDCGEFVRAARTAHLLRALARLDHGIVQDAFGEGRWPLEFRAAVARLLSQHAPNDREAPKPNSQRMGQRLDQTLSETMVLDLIELVGFVVVNNPQHQETICSGWSAVKTLCTLPANWLVSKRHAVVLLPALAVLAQHPPSAATISKDLNLDMIEEYITSPEATRIKLVQLIKEGRQKKAKK